MERPKHEHWLDIARSVARSMGRELDDEEAWAWRRALFDAHAEGRREGRETAHLVPGAKVTK